jgi:hypothetical protein
MIQDDPNHDLKAGYRCKLLLGFDEPSIPKRSLTGLCIRVDIAAKAVKYVMPLWTNVFPSNDIPKTALEMAEMAMAGLVSVNAAEKKISDLWVSCDELALKHQNRHDIIMVGYGAIQVIREAVSKNHLGRGKVSDSASDLDIDPYDHDSSFCAAVAYCGGPPWAQHSDSKKRLKFWTWWLGLLTDYL